MQFLLIFVALCGLFAFSDAGMYPKGSGVKALGAGHFPDANAQKSWMVEFYAPWCGHCQQLKPAWEQLAKKLDGSNIGVGAVDCDDKKNQQICGQYQIQGFPTIKMIKKGKAIDYNGPRDADSLANWAKQNAGGSSSSSSKKEKNNAGGGGGEKKASKCTGEYGGKVANLCGSHFPGKDATHNWIVVMYAPWCGHCKNLMPKWKMLPGALSVHAPKLNVKVGAIDCTQSENSGICQNHGVKGYPTIRLLKKGGKAETYQGPREPEEIARWLQSVIRD